MLNFLDSKNIFAGVFCTHRKRTNRNTPTQVTSNKLTHTWTKTNTYAIKHSTTYTQNTKKEMQYTYIYTCKCKHALQLYMWMPSSVYSRILPSIEIEIRHRVWYFQLYNCKQIHEYQHTYIVYVHTSVIDIYITYRYKGIYQ